MYDLKKNKLNQTSNGGFSTFNLILNQLYSNQ